MVNDIITGISRKLKATFGDGYKIYAEDVKQGLKEPCFFIALLAPGVTPRIGSRKLRNNSFDIHYFSKAGREEMQEAAERLIGGLEYIILSDGGKLRGTGMRYELVDGVLHFFISYNLFTIDSEEDEPMAEIEYDASIIGG